MNKLAILILILVALLLPFASCSTAPEPVIKSSDIVIKEQSALLQEKDKKIARLSLQVDEILKAVIEKIPAPTGNPDAPFQALIFDSVFDPYRGINAYFKVFNGEIKTGEKVKFIATDKVYDADETIYKRI